MGVYRHIFGINRPTCMCIHIHIYLFPLPRTNSDNGSQALAGRMCFPCEQLLLELSSDTYRTHRPLPVIDIYCLDILPDVYLLKKYQNAYSLIKRKVKINCRSKFFRQWKATKAWEKCECYVGIARGYAQWISPFKSLSDKFICWNYKFWCPRDLYVREYGV